MQLVLALIAHTNVGKTALARTLLARDIGEVRDAPHVTEFVEEALLLREPETGHELVIADTPGFGDSRRLVARMRLQGQPVGWFLSQVWDRWRDRAFWGSQQALREVRDRAHAVLYLVNASEGEAGHLEPEMELLAWLGRPVVVLLNQLGPPRAPDVEAAELKHWRERLRRWPAVRDVLPLDAFARCWVQEAALWDAVQAALQTADERAAMAALARAWQRRAESTFDASMAVLADTLAGTLLTQVPLEDDDRARAALVERAEADARRCTGELLVLHGLSGRAEGDVMRQLAPHAGWHRRIGEGRAAVLGGALSGALAGLKADIATGGLTLGGGMLAGGLIGALGAAGLARGLNVVRGTARSHAAWPAEALRPMAEVALLRYLAVAHHGRGRGDWAEAETPAHWAGVVQQALQRRGPDWQALAERTARRARQKDDEGSGARVDARHDIRAGLQPLLTAAAADVLQALYGRGPLGRPGASPAAPPAAQSPA